MVKTLNAVTGNKGKPKKAIVVAIARKLLVWAFAICKSGQPFTPDYALA